MKKYKNIWLLIVSIFFIWLILTLIDNTRIQVTNYNITSKKLDDHIVIAQVSDLHNTTFGKNNHRLIKAIKKSKPDIITITGDLIDSSKPYINIAINFIKQAVKIAPTYYVPGNHEAWNLANYSKLKNKLKKAGVVVLEGDVKQIIVDHNKINILGILDPDFIGEAGIDELDVANTDLDTLNYETDNYTILLSHRPELLSAYFDRNIDLVLTGHAHGGQFRIEGLGGLIAPNQGILPKYTECIHTSKDKNTTMIISRGLGNSVIPLRINNNPELVIVNINNKKYKLKKDI